ncbi:regulator of chromosome condensation 1/beta-lactamase-inhibitor protein II [Mrakia frigida]|uniref:Fmp25p n=1 Tax=Mrakia frigida TaxID=29902 RepID=UPI003FCC00C0
MADISRVVPDGVRKKGTGGEEDLEPDRLSVGPKRHDDLETFSWGSNSNLTISPSTPSLPLVKTPRGFPALTGPGVALRDVALAQYYGAAVDGSGDVYMWGKDIVDGEPEKDGLKRCLVGLDITHLAPTKSKLFALSSSGNVYVLPTNSTLQLPPHVTSLPPPSAPLTPRYSFLQHIDPLHLFTSKAPSQQVVDFVRLDFSTEKKLGLNWGEKVVQISAGRDHLLAVTNKGRTLGHAVSEAANSNKQLVDMEEIVLPRPTTLNREKEKNERFRLISLFMPDYKKAVKFKVTKTVDPYLKQYLPKEEEEDAPLSGKDTMVYVQTKRGLKPEEDIRWSTTLYEIPILQGVNVDQVAAGERSSFARVKGRVVGWGANEYGQVGLGAGFTIDNVHVPTEVVLSRAQGYNGSHTIKCLDVISSGNTTFFTVQRTALDNPMPYIDLLACGHGTFGALGNGLWSQVSGNAVRVKTVSGLMEYSEKEKKQVPLGIHYVSASPTGSVAAVLNTTPLATKDGAFVYGRDLMVWGSNMDAQLGNGRRSNLPVPQHLPPLPSLSSTSPTFPVLTAKESTISSGSTSAMPHHRLQLAQAVVELRDLQGKKVKGKQNVEQVCSFGYGGGVVYWKVL